MKKTLKKLWPIGFIFFVWFIFSSPYFLKQQVPYPAKYQVNFFTPWSSYEQYAGPVKNGAVSDVVNQLYPWKHYTIETLKSGELPLWNPFSFSGTPHLANYQSAVLSPFNALFFVFSFVDAWSIMILLQPLLAGTFMYLFLKQVRVSVLGSLLGSISFMFCGFMVVWMVWGTLAMAIAFLPLSLYAIEKLFQKKSLGFSMLLSLSLLLSFFSGHFQTSLYFALYVLCFIIFKYFTTKNLQSFTWAIGGYTVGILFSLLQIIPTLQLYNLSVRSQSFSNGPAIPFYYLITALAPDFFGNPVTRNDWIGYYGEWASFIGIIPFALAIISIVGLFLKKEKENRYLLFFFLAGIIALILATDSPVQTILTSLKIPVFSTSIPSRIIVLFSFSFAVLAAFGYDRLIKLVQGKSFKNFISPFILVGLLLIGVWSVLLIFKVVPPDKTALAIRNFLLPSGLLFFAFGVALLSFITKRKIFLIALAWIILMITTVDSLRFASKWLPFESRALVFPQVPVITALQKNIGLGRAFGEFGGYLDMYYRIQSIKGYDPLYNQRYGEFIRSATDGTYQTAERSVVQLDKHGKYTDRVLDLLGVTIIYHPIAHTNQSWAYPVWKKTDKYTQIYKDDKFKLYKNNTAMPRVKLYTNYEVIPDGKMLVKRFYEDTFDYRNVLLLEERPTGDIKQKIQTEKSASPVGDSSAKIISYTSNKIIISVSSEEPAVLFLSDTYYPNWKARVNGKKVSVLRADYAFRAISVPKGKSTVEFYYEGLF